MLSSHWLIVKIANVAVQFASIIVAVAISHERSCHSSSFHFLYVAVSEPCRLSEFTLTRPHNTQEELEKTGQFFQVAINFHPSHPQPKIINTSFCALLGLLSTKLNHYFDDSIDSHMFFGYSK